MYYGHQYWHSIGLRDGKLGNQDYINGVIEGVIAHAVWRDGQQYVGTMRTLLSDEIATIKKALGWEEKVK